MALAAHFWASVERALAQKLKDAARNVLRPPYSRIGDAVNKIAAQEFQISPLWLLWPFYRIAPVMKNQRILFNYSEIAIDFTIFIVMYRARN